MVRAQAGDRDAYAALLVDVTPLLERYLGRRVSDPTEIHDVVQETLIHLHRARHTYDPRRRFEPWLLAIARHAAIDHARRRIGRLAREVPVDHLPDQPVLDGAPAVQRLAQAIEALPPSQREAFELLQLDGLSADAAAARIGVRPGTLRVRAHRAYTRIRALLLGE